MSAREVRTVPVPLTIDFRCLGGGEYDLDLAFALEDGTDRIGFRFRPSDMGCPADVENPWELRNDLFQYVGEGGRLSGVTLGWGRLGDGATDLNISRQQWEKLGPREGIEVEFCEWANLLRSAMLIESASWPSLTKKFDPLKVAQICTSLPVKIEWRNGRPVGVIPCTEVIPAIIATLHIDALLGAKYRFCACVGCYKSFRIKRTDQRYHSEECKHRQVMRNSRSAAKASKSTKFKRAKANDDF